MNHLLRLALGFLLAIISTIATSWTVPEPVQGDVAGGQQSATPSEAMPPPNTNPMSSTSGGYLPPEQLMDIKQWLPVAPKNHSAAQATDISVFKSTRRILKTSRGMQAAEDDVFDPPLVVGRFADSIAVTLTETNVPTLMALIKKIQADASQLVKPVKVDVKEGGRVRPFVAYPKAPSCLSPVDMAHHRETDIDVFHLDKSGSYPSTHALVGMLMAMILSETVPDHADAAMARGLEFGESRVICGFHYESDVVAGRLAGAALFARLHGDSAFVSDLTKARDEIASARTRQ